MTMPMARREALLGLGIADRRFGYPLELLVRAGQAGWRVVVKGVTPGLGFSEKDLRHDGS